MLDAAQDAVSADDDDRQARPSGEVVVETRSWIAIAGAREVKNQIEAACSTGNRNVNRSVKRTYADYRGISRAIVPLRRDVNPVTVRVAPELLDELVLRDEG